MKIELECCEFKPRLMQILIDDEEADFKILGNLIIVETNKEQIKKLTIKKRRFPNTKLSYLNIINPIHYFYEFRFRNNDILYYDKGNFLIDINFDEYLNTDLKLKITKGIQEVNSQQIENYSYSIENKKINYNIITHSVPTKEILRYKLSNVLCQFLWSAFIISLVIKEIILHSEGSIGYLIAAIIILFISSFRIWKYLNLKWINFMCFKSSHLCP